MIRSLIIQINSKCNINCSYCYSKNKFNYNKNRLDYSICKILKKFDIKDATITGGEPLLDYKFLVKIIKKLKRRGVRITLITNGLLLDRKKMIKLKEFGVLLRISIDGLEKNEKKPSKPLIGLVKNNHKYLKYAAKVISKKNLINSYKDFIGLVHLGFRDIDVIPQMYTYWSKKEIKIMVINIKKIIKYCNKNKIKINLDSIGSSNRRYYNCEKIRVLPDGNISLCNALNCTKKTKFVTDIERINEFKKNVIDYALKNYYKKKWFKEEYLNSFCLVDTFYDDMINKKRFRVIRSNIDLFSKLRKL